MRPDTEDAVLVRRAQDGYLDAYAALVERHGLRAYRVALRLLASHQDAEDIAQEALLAAWEQLGTFRADADFTTWLYRIVTNRALNRLTRRRATSSLDVAGDAAAPGGPAAEAERNQAIDAVTSAVAALPPPQRVAIVLRHFEDLPNDQIARITSSTVPAVRSHLFRGRRTLAKSLADWR